MTDDIPMTGPLSGFLAPEARDVTKAYAEGHEELCQFRHAAIPPVTFDGEPMLCDCELIRTVRERTNKERDWERDALIDALEDVINQACRDGDELDSMALSAYAHGLRTLAKYERVEITAEHGRRVIAKWIEHEA